MEVPGNVAHTNSRICVIAHALNVCSTQPPATAEMSQRGSPLRMLLAVLFFFFSPQSLWCCPFRIYPNSRASALGKEQQRLLSALPRLSLSSFQTERGKWCFFFFFFLLFASFCFVSSFWIVRTRLNCDLFGENHPSPPPSSKAFSVCCQHFHW